MRRVLIVLLLLACVGIVQAEQRSISVNYTFHGSPSGWGFHDHISRSSDPYAGYYNEPNQVPHILPTTNWNESSGPENGVPWNMVDHTGSPTGAYLMESHDFMWHTSWYQNITNTLPEATEWEKNAGRLAVRFIGHYPDEGQVRPLTTMERVPYGKYHVITYMHPNREDTNEVLSIGDTTYYYLSEHSDTMTARINAGGDPYILAANTEGPAAERANCAIFTNVTEPKMAIDFDSTSNSGVSAFQIIAAEERMDLCAVPAPANNSRLIPIGTTLEWTRPLNYEPTSYDVYLGEYGDPNWAAAPAATGLTTTSFDPVDLEYNTMYVWRVDAHASDGTVHTGDLWYLETEGDPIIEAQPNSTAAPVGGGTFFAVDALLTDTYTWYYTADDALDTPEDDVELQAGPSNVLEINDFQETDTGFYYCVLTNNLTGNPVYTETAELVVGRLEAYYPFDGDPNDASGYDWDLIGGNDPNITHDYEAGVIGDAIRFAGTGDQLILPGSEEYFNFFTKGMTLNWWVKTDEYAHYFTYLAKGNSGSNGWRMFDSAFYYGVGYSPRIYPLGGSTDTGRLDDGQWHMLTCTYDGATQTLRAYVDGVEDITPSTGEVFANSATIRIGSYNATGTEGWPYEGLMDDLEIYSYPLSSLEIAKKYTAVFSDTSICAENPPYDFDGDCKIGLSDFAMFAESWLDCNLVPDCS